MLWTFSSAVSKTGGGRGEDLGALPRTLLRKLLERSFLRTFKNFIAIGFLFLSLHCTDFRCSRIPCYEFRLLRTQSRPAGLGRLRFLRYRIEMVGKLHLNRAERPMCRSGLNKRYLLTSSYSERKYIPPHQSLNATNCLQFSSPWGEAVAFSD